MLWHQHPIQKIREIILPPHLSYPYPIIQLSNYLLLRLQCPCIQNHYKKEKEKNILIFHDLLKLLLLLRSIFLQAFSQPNSRFPRRHFPGSKRFQQHPKLFKSLLLQQPRAKFKKPFQRLRPLLLRWRVEPPPPEVRWRPAGCSGGGVLVGAVASGGGVVAAGGGDHAFVFHDWAVTWRWRWRALPGG